MLFSKFFELLSNLVSICKTFLEVKKENKEKKVYLILIIIIVALAFYVVKVEQFTSKQENEKLVNKTIENVTVINNYYESDYASGENTSGNDENSNSESMTKKGNDDETAATTGTSNLKRNLYSLKQANEGAVVEAVTFNAYKITDSDDVWYKELTGQEIPKGTLRNETNFVGARLNTGINAGKDNIWEGTEIVAEDGQTYLVRIYIHNNGDDVAEDTKIRFYVPYATSDAIKVNGWLTSSNAEPNEYLDNVIFKSKDGSPFHLEYVEESALLENGGMAKGEGKVLPDNICNQGDPTNTEPNQWITIGYDAFDGKIPGGYEYINYATIQVKVVYD